MVQAVSGNRYLVFGVGIVCRFFKTRFQRVQPFTARCRRAFWRCTSAKIIGLVVFRCVFAWFISDFKRDFSTYSRLQRRVGVCFGVV